MLLPPRPSNPSLPTRWPTPGARGAGALLLTVALHTVFGLLAAGPPPGARPGPGPGTAAAEPTVLWLAAAQPTSPPLPPPPPPQRAPARQFPPARVAVAATPAWVPQQAVAAVAPAPASMAAPPPPSAADWALAGRYTLKNSKAYRHAWGQQIRSQMGTAIEGPDQGLVRFRVEIAPDGALARLDTLWSTSAVAERLARQAIEKMPRWAPTPTGRPLVFEKTIAFTPYAVDGPPIFKDDCLPDPPAFSNPFAWNGRGTPRQRPAPPPPEAPDPQTLEDCRRQLPPDSIEAESALDQRRLQQWGSIKPGR